MDAQCKSALSTSLLFKKEKRRGNVEKDIKGKKGGKTSMTLLCEPQDVSIEEIIYYPNLSLKLNFVFSPKLMMTDTGLCQHARMLINYIL